MKTETTPGQALLRRIAVIRVHGGYSSGGYGDHDIGEYDQIIANCTKFELVTNEEYDTLHKAFARKNTGNISYHIIEQVDGREIKQTVAAYLKELKRAEEAAAAHLAKVEKDRLARLAARTAKTEGTKRKRLEKLAAECGVKIVEPA